MVRWSSEGAVDGKRREMGSGAWFARSIVVKLNRHSLTTKSDIADVVAAGAPAVASGPQTISSRPIFHVLWQRHRPGSHCRP